MNNYSLHYCTIYVAQRSKNLEVSSLVHTVRYSDIVVHSSQCFARLGAKEGTRRKEHFLKYRN